MPWDENQETHKREREREASEMSQVNLKAVVVSGEGDKIGESLTGTAAPMQPLMEKVVE